MINVGTELLFLKSDKELAYSIKNALVDIQQILSDYAIEKNVYGNVSTKTNCEEFCIGLLTDNFIQQLQLGNSFIEAIFANLANLKGNTDNYTTFLQNPAFSNIKTRSGPPSSGVWINHVKQRFWLYLAYPLLLRLWQDRALLLPTSFKSNFKLLLLGGIEKFDKEFYETKLLPLEDNDSLKLAKGFLTATKGDPAREKEVRHRAFRFVLATNWFSAPILSDLTECHVVQSYYWVDWYKKKQKNVGPTVFGNLCHSHHFCNSYFNVIEALFRRGLFIACFPALANEFKKQIRKGQLEAERVIHQQTMSITKEHLTDLSDDEAWNYWGEFEIGKRFYDSGRKFSFELLEFYTDIDKSLLSNWIMYSEEYLSFKSGPKLGFRKNGFNYLLKYLLYLASWFKNNASNSKIIFPKNFSLFTRSLYIIRQKDDSELPNTLADFTRDFVNKSAAFEIGQFLRWIQHESSFQLEKEHSQSRALILEKEFQLKWAEILKSEYSTDVKGDAKFAMNTTDFTNLKHFMKTQEKYYMGVQDFVLKEVLKAKQSPDNANSNIIAGEAESLFLLRVSEQALRDLGWSTLCDVKGTSDKKLGIKPSIRNPAIGNKSWIEIDYKKSKRHLSKNCFKIRHLDANTAKVKTTYLKGKAPVNVPVQRIMHKDVGVSIMMPTLLVLRPQLLAAELGIRHKHAFALDAAKFDDYVDKEADKELGVTTLLITTDKVKTKPWLRPVDWTTLEMLWREVEFRKQYQSHYNIYKHHYNNGLSFYCLFSFPDRAEYASPMTRNEHWLATLTAFGIHQSRHKKRHIRFCRYCPRNPKGKRDDQAPRMTFYPEHPLVLKARSLMNNKTKGVDGIETIVQNPYTKITLRAKHTPHSTRNSFISGLMGLIDIEDIACLVGQKSIATTVHYNQVTAEKFSKLQQSQRVIKTESGAESELARRFKTDSIETAKVHGFSSIDIHKENSENSDANYNNKRPSGLVILQTANFDEVAFTDTHICPYGLNCPDEIQKENGGYRKCALCRAKVVAFDHGPAIAKRIELTEVNLLKAFIDHKKHYDVHGENETNFKNQYDDLAEEMAGWELTLQHQERKRQQALTDLENGTFKSHLSMSIMLDPTIQLEKDKAPVDEVLLSSIEDMITYRGLAASSPMLMDISCRIKNKILFSLARANPDSVEGYLHEIANTDANEATLLQVSSMIRTLISSKAIDRSKLLEIINSERISYTLPDSRKPSFLKVDDHVTKLLASLTGTQ